MSIGRAAVRYAVQCSKHGVELTGKGWKAVFVGPPLTRGKAKTAGCPNCKAERSKEAAAAPTA